MSDLKAEPIFQGEEIQIFAVVFYSDVPEWCATDETVANDLKTPDMLNIEKVLQIVKTCCIIANRTTVYFDFERDGESSSFHSYLSHSLRKPYKSFPPRYRCRKLLLNGLAPLRRR